MSALMEDYPPLSRWAPLRIHELAQRFAHAPFEWGLAGGYAIEQFLGKAIRDHGDIDIVVFRDEHLLLQHWLADWHLSAADPPGTLRRWETNEYLPIGIHDIWGYQHGAQAWQLQIMLNEVEGDEWVSRRNPQIRGARGSFWVDYNGIRCIPVEVQILYKAKNRRPKDEIDFQACHPLLAPAARQWLKDGLQLLYPEGHPWLTILNNP